jgi:HK97 family phage portal protein
LKLWNAIRAATRELFAQDVAAETKTTTAEARPLRVPRDVEGIEDEIESRGSRIVLVSAERRALDEFLRGGDVVAPDEVGSGQRESMLWTAASSLWVQVAISLVAQNLAAVPLQATRKSRKGAKGGKVEDAPDSDLQRLLDSPAPGVDASDLVEEWVTNLEATGSGFLAVARPGGVTNSTEGRVEQLLALRSSRIEINPGRNGEWIESITFRKQGVGHDIPFGNVIYARHLHPTNDYWGLSRLGALRASIEADHNVAEYNAAIVRKHGVPAVFLKTDQAVSRSSAKRIEREWKQRHGRAEQAGDAMVVDRGMTPMSPQFRPRDMEWVAMARISKRRIFAAFGVPPAIGFDFDEASELANATAQRRVFYENTLRPLATKLLRPLGRFARENFGEEWGVRHRWEEVDALREDDATTRESVRSDYQAGLITLNEARGELDYEPVQDGERFAETAPPAAPAAPAEQPEMDDEHDDEDMPDEPDEMAGKPKGTVAKGPASLAAARKAGQSTDEMRRMARAGYMRLHRRWEPRWIAETERAFEEQGARVMARTRALLGDGKALRKALSPDDILAQVFRDDEEAEEFRKILGPVFLAGVVDAGNTKLEDLLSEENVRAFQETHQRVRDAVTEWGAKKIVGIIEETRSGIEVALRDALETGADNRALQDAIAGYFEHVVEGDVGADSRAERIARTETGTALNVGGFEATRQIEDAGGKVAKSWLSSRDELVRETHQQADRETRGKPIALQDQFSNGLQHPNDPVGPAGEVVNCRCSMIEEVVELPPPPEA